MRTLTRAERAILRELEARVTMSDDARRRRGYLPDEIVRDLARSGRVALRRCEAAGTWAKDAHAWHTDITAAGKLALRLQSLVDKVVPS
jgi:hypothetical protein